MAFGRQLDNVVQQTSDHTHDCNVKHTIRYLQRSLDLTAIIRNGPFGPHKYLNPSFSPNP